MVIILPAGGPFPLAEELSHITLTQNYSDRWKDPSTGDLRPVLCKYDARAAFLPHLDRGDRFADLRRVTDAKAVCKQALIA